MEKLFGFNGAVHQVYGQSSSESQVASQPRAEGQVASQPRAHGPAAAAAAAAPFIKFKLSQSLETSIKTRPLRGLCQGKTSGWIFMLLLVYLVVRERAYGTCWT